ncbi:hypothetical protein [Brucella inopinata]|uniref:hypothetical protein n=1 Tax=Brucella inopinata TaxID=1218315 RepID=UPI000870EE16|nr:hypothetical protein [Brucella inopinata]SCD23646.1 putative secreted protein [Brucella inopinata]
MKRIATALLILIAFSATAIADDASKAKLDEFSSDLLALYSLSGTTKRQLSDMNPKAQTYAVSRLLKQTQAFQAKWGNSDLIEIERFRLSGGDQLVIDVEYRFK